MKNFLLILGLLITNLVFSQTITSTYLKDTSTTKVSDNLTEKSGTLRILSSCAVPTGSMNSTPITPPSYAWLQTNGYCNPSTYGKTGTVCWTFIPTGNSVTINSGYSSSGCGSITFGPFNLYTCAPACVSQGTGLTFAVTPGQCYTWCMGYNGTGGLCSFNDFCPYFQQSTVLPIELVYFAGSNQGEYNVFSWKTASETNNNYFSIEYSVDAINWNELGRIPGAGNSSTYNSYEYKTTQFTHTVNYYRIKQVDFNGAYKTYGIIVIDNTIDYNVKLIKTYNLFGQEVDEYFKGLVIEFYDDGSTRKVIRE